MVRVHPFIHDELNHKLCILLRIFFEIRNDVVQHETIGTFDLFVIQYHINDFRILSLDRQINGISMFLRLDLNVQAIGMKLEEVFRNFIAPIFQSHDQRRRLIVILLIDINNWLAGVVFVYGVQVYEVPEQYKLVVFDELMDD